MGGPSNSNTATLLHFPAGAKGLPDAPPALCGRCPPHDGVANQAGIQQGAMTQLNEVPALATTTENLAQRSAGAAHVPASRSITADRA